MLNTIINKLFPSRLLKKEIQQLKLERDSLKEFQKQKDLKWAAYESLVGAIHQTKIDQLSEEEQQTYFRGCKELLDNPHFIRLVDDFLCEQEQHILKNIEKESVLENVRSCCITLDQIKVRAKQNADHITKEPEKFDKHAII